MSRGRPLSEKLGEEKTTLAKTIAYEISEAIPGSLHELLEIIGSLRDPKMRRAVYKLLESPSPICARQNSLYALGRSIEMLEQKPNTQSALLLAIWAHDAKKYGAISPQEQEKVINEACDKHPELTPQIAGLTIGREAINSPLATKLKLKLQKWRYENRPWKKQRRKQLGNGKIVGSDDEVALDCAQRYLTLAAEALRCGLIGPQEFADIAQQTSEFSADSQQQKRQAGTLPNALAHTIARVGYLRERKSVIAKIIGQANALGIRKKENIEIQ